MDYDDGLRFSGNEFDWLAEPEVFGFDDSFDPPKAQVPEVEASNPVIEVAPQSLTLTPLSKPRQSRGRGPDARPDPHDDYNYQAGFHFNEIRKLVGHLRNTQIFAIVKYIEVTLGSSVRAGRFEKRRLPVAYQWLDEHQPQISQYLLQQAITDALRKTRYLSS
jgi:hypothetical protein